MLEVSGQPVPNIVCGFLTTWQGASLAVLVDDVADHMMKLLNGTNHTDTMDVVLAGARDLNGRRPGEIRSIRLERSAQVLTNPYQKKVSVHASWCVAGDAPSLRWLSAILAKCFTASVTQRTKTVRSNAESLIDAAIKKCGQHACGHCNCGPPAKVRVAALT